MRLQPFFLSLHLLFKLFPSFIHSFIQDKRRRSDRLIFVFLFSTQALQAAVQKIHTYVASLEEKMDAMEKRKK